MHFEFHICPHSQICPLIFGSVNPHSADCHNLEKKVRSPAPKADSDGIRFDQIGRGTHVLHP